MLGISVLNTRIYDYYNNDETDKLGKVFEVKHVGYIIIFFTFRWKIGQDDSKEICRLKKYLNYSAILFGVLTVLAGWTLKESLWMQR